MSWMECAIETLRLATIMSDPKAFRKADGPDNFAEHVGAVE